MKKLLVITLVALSSFYCNQSFAQFNKYHPFPDSNAGWRITSVGTSSPPSNVFYYEYDYYVRGDTLVNGKKYFKLNTSGGYIHYQGNPDTAWSCYDSLCCLLREDTLAKKIYASFSPNYGIKDTLLYDFNLNIGDTLPNSYINQSWSGNHVVAIDSILIGTAYRKQFIIAAYIGSFLTRFDSLIEGIGSAEGLLEPIRPFFEGGSQMDCFIDSTITLSYNNSYSSCNIFHQCSTSGIAPLENPTISITASPNPSNGQFKVVCHSEQSEESQPIINVYNVLGEHVLSETLRSTQGDNSINISNQPNGVYLYRVITETGVLVGEGKLMIQK